jgi:hypothetical protein
MPCGGRNRRDEHSRSAAASPDHDAELHCDTRCVGRVLAHLFDFTRLCRCVGWGWAMNLPPPKICQRAKKLFAQMGSSGRDAEVAGEMLKQLIEEHGLTWNDLPRILAADVDPAGTVDDTANNDADAAATQPTADDIPDILGLVLALLEEHASTTAEQRLAIALWILHCWVFDQFVITPRLALLSPVRGCGKTTLLALIELLQSHRQHDRGRHLLRSRSPAPYCSAGR